MPTRRRFISLAAITLGCAPLAACVASPSDVAQLNQERSLQQRSQHGLVEATVSLQGPELARGPNDFSIALRAVHSRSTPLLSSVDATMAAHGHHASASNIVGDGDTFRAIGVDLFMSGRWQVALGVELDEGSDVVEFALDVP